MKVDKKERAKSKDNSTIKFTKPFNYYKIFYIYVFCSLTDRQMDKIIIEYMLIYERNMHRKNQTSILISGRENFVFP